MPRQTDIRHAHRRGENLYAAWRLGSRSRPGSPVGRQLPSADEISADTHASVSTSARHSNASVASADAIRPSAQAAWPGTSGEGSDKATVNEGTPSSAAQLPNAAASPERPGGQVRQGPTGLEGEEGCGAPFCGEAAVEGRGCSRGVRTYGNGKPLNHNGLPCSPWSR